MKKLTTTFLISFIICSCNNINKEKFKNEILLNKKDSINEIKIDNYKKDSINQIIEECENNKKLIDYYSHKGNLMFLDDYKLDPISEYFIFKKFGLVSASNYGSLTSDSCSKVKINEILQQNKKFNFISIKKSIDSITSLGYIKTRKHYDGIYCRFGNVGIDNRILDKYNELLKNVLKKDSTFRINGFWLVIDKYGKTKKIESYIKHSDEIDNYVKKFLINYKWKPGRLRKSKDDFENVEIRTEFILIHYEEYQFPQLPAFLLD
jgi:hypothetical protein